MALIKCQECGKEISDNAESCPNCGNKDILINKKKYSSQIKTGSIVSLIANSLVILLLIGFLVMCFNIPDTPNNTGGTHIQISLTPETITGIPLLCFLLSIILAIVNFILVIIFLCKKINNVKLYKWLLLLFSIVQLISTFISIAQLICCGIVYCIFPIINFIGAIIVATGKVK